MRKRNYTKLSERLLFFFAISLSLSGSMLAQQFSIKTADGYLFIQNGKENSFSCEIKGKDIVPSTAADNPSFKIGDLLIQILTVPANQYEPTGKVEASKLLEKHRDWEIDYLNGVFGSKLVFEGSTMSVNGRAALSWSFKRTKFLDEFDRDIFLTTLIGRDIFGMNCPGKIGQPAKACQDLEAEIMKTLKVSIIPFDIQKISNDLKHGSKLVG